MLLNPNKMVEDNVIHNIDKETQLQPNSIDLTLKSIKLITGGELMKESCKIKRDELKCEGNVFNLHEGQAYNVEFNEFVSIPNDIVAFVIHRSTLNRMGAQITSGIYDSGFNNYAGAVLKTARKIKIEKNTRIATMFFIQAESSHIYNGQYQGERDLFKNHPHTNKFDSVKMFEQVLERALMIMKERNEQYGSSWKKLSIKCIAQIAEMKLNRIARLGNNAKSADEFIDAINYSIFGLMRLQMDKDNV